MRARFLPPTRQIAEHDVDAINFESGRDRPHRDAIHLAPSVQPMSVDLWPDLATPESWGLKTKISESARHCSFMSSWTNHCSSPKSTQGIFPALGAWIGVTSPSARPAWCPQWTPCSGQAMWQAIVPQLSDGCIPSANIGLLPGRRHHELREFLASLCSGIAAFRLERATTWASSLWLWVMRWDTARAPYERRSRRLPRRPSRAARAPLPRAWVCRSLAARGAGAGHAASFGELLAHARGGPVVHRTGGQNRCVARPPL